MPVSTRCGPAQPRRGCSRQIRPLSASVSTSGGRQGKRRKSRREPQLTARGESRRQPRAAAGPGCAGNCAGCGAGGPRSKPLSCSRGAPSLFRSFPRFFPSPMSPLSLLFPSSSFPHSSSPSRLTSGLWRHRFPQLIYQFNNGMVGKGEARPAPSRLGFIHISARVKMSCKIYSTCILSKCSSAEVKGLLVPAD